jgi:hypothetical protein
MNPGRLQRSQSPLQGSLQHTPSMQFPLAQSAGPLQASPPETLHTCAMHEYPAAHCVSFAQAVKQPEAPSQPYGAHSVEGGEASTQLR